MSSPGRNDPCPCGSGRKYKRCCGVDDAARAPLEVAAGLHGLDNEIVGKVVSFGRRFHAERLEAALDECPFDPDAEVNAVLLGPYLAYVAPFGDRSLADTYASSRGDRLDPAAAEWLEANGRSWLSVWEVVEVKPEESLWLRDLLSGEERLVVERMGTRGMEPGLALCARIVDAVGLSLMVGSHPRPLRPVEADGVVALARQRLGAASGRVPVERLRAFQQELLGLWEDRVATTDRRPLPTLQNTDGDPLQETVDHFALAPGTRRPVERLLATLDGFQIADLPREDRHAATVFSVVRPGKSGSASLENVSLGQVEVDAAEVRISTNSERRADRLRQQVERACAPHLAHRERERRDLQDLMASAVGRSPKGTPRADAISPEVGDAVVRRFKAEHYARWPDEPVPALGGLTPREAARRPDERPRLIALLKDFEMSEARERPTTRFDVAALREELGIGRE